MSGGGALNLSLLSRGIGEVQKNGHEKVEVFLEPSDYFNFGADRPYYLPPIHQSYHFTETSPRFSTRSSRDGSEIPLPKTFTTRKGALLLFSEDMAMKTNEKEHVRKTARHRHHSFHSSFSPHGSFNEDETAIVLKTVDDLAKSILQYGATRHSYDDDDDKMYLKFIHRRREQWERQIRPGYSAKRYLSTWTRNWDDQVFETVVSKGYLTERSLFHYNLFLPHLRRHLFHEDLSNMPQPYRLMKNMLLSPGSLSGYTFYRAADFGALMEEDEDGADGQKIKRPDTKRSIRVIRTNKEGVQKEVSYSALDKDTQKEVITDLLVKSAVHYALSKQEEIIEESLAQAMQQSEHGGESSATTYELSVTRKTPDKGMPGFDMRDAVDSLLNTQRSTGPYVLGGDLPEAVDAHSHSSEHTGSFKGGAVPQHAVKAMGARQTPKSNLSTPMDAGGGGNGGGKDKEFMGDLPVAAVRDVSASSSQSQHSSVPQLPPITRHTLSPIRDVSRETSQLVTLPPIFKDGQEELKQSDTDMPTVQVVPPTPQLSNMSMPTTRSEAQQRELQKVIETEAVAESEAAEYHASSDSTPSESAAMLTHRTGRTSKSKTSKGPKVSHGEDVSKGKGILFQPPEWTSNLPSHNVIPPLPPHSHGWEYGRVVEGHGHRTGRSMAGGSVESKSMKGSMIMAPDGEIISVGGSVARPHDVGMISDVTLQQRQFEVNITDESGLSDDEPDEWRAASKLRKPRTMSSKLSESLKRSVGKRESETSVGSGTKSVVSSGKEEKEAGSGPSMIIKKSSVVSKEADVDSLASASIPSQTGRSSVTEQDILDTLTEHAKMIADSVLSNKQAGQDLEEDVRHAADKWMESHPTQSISRSHSVQDALKAGAVDEIMKARRASSAGPSTDEYKDLIRQSLTTAVVKAAGLDPEQVPEDAEISPDLLDALASQKLSPDDIAIVHDEETGRAVIKSRQEITQALGGVAEGHIYVAPNGKGGSIAGSDVGMRRQMSIPADRASLVDNMDYDVISYGGTEIMSERGRPAGRSKAGSKPGSLAGGTVADLKDHSIDTAKLSGGSSPEAEQDEFAQRLQQIEKDKDVGDEKPPSLKSSSKGGETTPVLPGDSSPKMQLDLDRQSAKTGVSQKTDKSDESKKKEKKVKTPEEPFVVGLVDHKAELSKLYGAQGPGTLPKTETKSPVKGKKPKKDDKKDKSKKKGSKPKKKGKKEEEPTPEVGEETPAPEPPAPEPVVETKKPTPQPTPREPPEPPKPLTASSSERPFLSSPELTRTDDEMEFTIVREESSPEPEQPQKFTIPPPFPEEEEDIEEEEEEVADDPGEDSNLKSISNREARAAKRAAAAAKRKEEVEKRRREREEQLKREKEEQERQEQLKKEMETERKRREEERRLRKQQEAEEADREERARQEAERKKRQAEERERRAKEEYQRKLEEMRRKQIEEEAKRMELLLQKQKEEEERRAEEELLMSQMAEQERLEYERKKKEEEEERKRLEEEERRKREEEAQKAMEEARRLAEEMARKQAELEARLKFNRALQVEASGLDHSHDINRAFVFSYFELLQWLGLDIPEFELSKMTQPL